MMNFITMKNHADMVGGIREVSIKGIKEGNFSFDRYLREKLQSMVINYVERIL